MIAGADRSEFRLLPAGARAARSPRRRKKAQSSMRRTRSVVEWDGKPGRMPPRIGAWQPERLRYGAASRDEGPAKPSIFDVNSVIKWYQMKHLMVNGKRTFLSICLLQISLCVTFGQQPSSTARCQVSTSPPLVRAEGLTERLGDIVLQCSGAVPGTLFSGNVTVIFPVSVTNRVDANNLTRDAVVSVDLGSGFVPTAIAGQVSGNSISFNGISYTAPASGNVNLRISGVRAAMNQLGLTSAVPATVTAFLSSSLAVDQSQLVVAYSQAGLLSSLSNTTITCVGSPAPGTFDLPNLFAAGTAFASTRVTEGFATAFEARTAETDTGTRFLVKYTGFPATTRLYIPDAVAGSDALQPAGGGDLTLPQAVGQYMPGSGALVLVRVLGADATGAGGYAVAAPQGASPV